MAQYILMNQNTEVARIEYRDEISTIISIDEMMHAEYAPLRLVNAKWQKTSELKALNEWFKGRGIPGWRDDLERILTNLGVAVPEELLNRAFALSLSEQYWLKPLGTKVEWSQINFFEHDFKGADFANATFRALMGEDHGSTMGALHFRGQRDGRACMQPQLAEERRLDFMTPNNTSDTELVLAHDVYFTKRKPNHINDYELYIGILEEHGISNARMQMENMLVLDYLLMNEEFETRVRKLERRKVKA